jgi:signal transduction histidine kinase
VTLVERPSGPTPGRTSARPPRRVLWTAAITWGVLVGVLAGLPGLETVDETGPATLPGPGSAAWWGCLVTVTLQAAALLGAAVRPRAVPVAVAALALPLAAAGTGDLFSLSSGAVTVATFLAVLARPLRALAVPLTLTALLVAVGEAVNALVGGTAGPAGAVSTGLLQAVGAVGVPLLVALVVVARRDARAARRQEAAAELREQDALVRAAVADERTAMARELHDIAAHHLSGIAVMAAAIERQIDVDPARAKTSVRLVREQSTAVLDDLRRLVGLLRTDADAARDVHALAGLAELVATSRRAGADVELRTRVAPGAVLADRLGPIAQLTAYRVAQEALANAARHAPGAAVVVEVDDLDGGTLLLTVTNRAPAEAPAAGRAGYGLLGMRERADLVGADLAYGPTPEGGWQVRLSLAKERGTAPADPSSSGVGA